MIKTTNGLIKSKFLLFSPTTRQLRHQDSISMTYGAWKPRKISHENWRWRCYVFLEHVLKLPWQAHSQESVKKVGWTLIGSIKVRWDASRQSAPFSCSLNYLSESELTLKNRKQTILQSLSCWQNKKLKTHQVPKWNELLQASLRAFWMLICMSVELLQSNVSVSAWRGIILIMVSLCMPTKTC